jgi:pimeloyl-ACP methyl ester carboxylesterase
MRTSGTGKIRDWALRRSARALNLVYNIASAANRRTLQKMAESAPRSLAPRPENVEEQTLKVTIPVLQHVVEDVTGEKQSEPAQIRIALVMREGIDKGTFKNYGQAILINPHRVDELLEDLEIAPELKPRFLAEVKKHFLLPDAFQASQINGVFGREFRQRGQEEYIERTYTVLTRDGKTIDLTRVVNLNRVKSNDNSPSVLWVPGIACSYRSFDLEDETSPVLEAADRGDWNYLFDPRGLGRNKGNFDPLCFLDTLISNDLPAAVEFIHDRPAARKPVILLCHSMGGIIAEFMLVRQSYKLDQILGKISEMAGEKVFSIRGKTRAEIYAYLDRVEALCRRRASGKKVRALIADARGYLKILSSVKGLITLGSSKAFDKDQHPIYPILLMLNIVLPLFGSTDVPVDKGKWLVEAFPRLAAVLRPLINAGNFSRADDFLAKYVTKGTDTFPLGVGFQLLKAIYSGRGIRRMDRDKFNYSAHLHLIPVDIPIFHIVGDADPLAPPFNMAFIDRRCAAGCSLDFSTFPPYSHPIQEVHHLSTAGDLDTLSLRPQASQVQGFVVRGIRHLDYLYGKTAESTVRPLLHQIIPLIWQAQNQ